ncbi:unnamed protein product [Arabidopsis arenosa]|uniref:Uncharacterized protein n=1 Tax=Arabidopsis arenosa TaxID=38785 RepID=A0A8S1ZKU1_ARAAE|nr:unnamed protein product [Arabidopsis arenosa]
MLDLRYKECYFLICVIVFINFVPCYSDERLFDGKSLYAGKELWKETLPLKSGSRVYKLQGLKSNSWYEVKISYPASIPALFTLQLLKNGVMGLHLNHMRRLLNTEKLIFKTESLEEVDNKDGLYVLVTVEPEGIVAIPNSKERVSIIYNIGKLLLFFLTLVVSVVLLLKSEILMLTVCEEQLLGIPYSSWSVVVLVVLCLVVALILPRFLPSYLLIKDVDRDR